MSRISAQVLMVCLLAYCVTECMSASTGPTCSESNKPCNSNADCCSMCCQKGVCITSCKHNPCDVHFCPSGKHCVLEAVTCIRAPCNPVPSCLPDDYDEDYGNKGN